MNKFEKQLEKWNNGVLRGAQAKLAKTLKVSTATTALWATGKRRPSKGYVAQMARLFKLDIYQVVKLFEAPAAVTYPAPHSSLHNLHDDPAAYQPGPDFTAEETAQSNSVLLPFLAQPAPDYPHICEENILEWWRIPRRFAQGAKYIISSRAAGFADVQTDTDLSFVKPAVAPASGQLVLFTDGKNCQVCRAVRRGAGLSYQTLTGKAAKISSAYKPVGVILYRLKPC